jgi:rfaE bifunctional protein kinase chain/domain
MTPAAVLLEKLSKLRILIVGDVCLDRWCRYSAPHSEASRETGINRIAVVRTGTSAGAAGTIANNLAALGAAHVSVLGAIGDDGFGFEVSRALVEQGISAEPILRTPLIQTFTYTKLINDETGVEDLPRVDFINASDLPREVESQLVETFERIARSFDLVIVSDQAETVTGGVVTAAMRDAVCRHAGQHLVWADSRIRSEHFRKAVVKPNEKEGEAAAMRALGRVDFEAFRRHLQSPLLVVTRGGRGASIYDDAGERLIPGSKIAHPVDICGAGDSFTAGAAPILKITGSPDEAVRFGNIVASITVMKPGTGTASPQEVLEAERRWSA